MIAKQPEHLEAFIMTCLVTNTWKVTDTLAIKKKNGAISTRTLQAYMNDAVGKLDGQLLWHIDEAADVYKVENTVLRKFLKAFVDEHPINQEMPYICKWVSEDTFEIHLR